MVRLAAFVATAGVLVANSAAAQNGDDVVAGTDVALTGGAVVANVHTGGAMWFNPAGVARLDARSVDLTGSVLSYNLVKAPGALTLESGPQSPGDFSTFIAIPRALTFVASPRVDLRWGLGFFFSRVSDRFLQDSVSAQPGQQPESDFFAAVEQTRSVYHVSSALAWKKGNDKLLIGGGFDIVFATQSGNQILAGGIDGGAGGASTQTITENLSGGGLQMKFGVQVAPMKTLRIGVMVATPSYLVFLNEDRTFTETIAPPQGPPTFQGAATDGLSGTWSGVEPGLARAGIAWIRQRGWVEADVIVRFALDSAPFEIDWKTVADARIGGIVRLSKRLKVGGGFSTDFSSVGSLDQLGESQIDYYRFTIGFDFANREKPPERGEGGFYLAFAVAGTYAYGKGQLAGAFIADQSVPTDTTVNIVPITSNQFGINLAIKAGF